MRCCNVAEEFYKLNGITRNWRRHSVVQNASFGQLTSFISTCHYPLRRSSVQNWSVCRGWCQSDITDRHPCESRCLCGSNLHRIV